MSRLPAEGGDGGVHVHVLLLPVRALPLLPAQLLRLARPDKKPDHQALAGQCLNDDLLELIMITEIYMLFHFICREAVTMKLGNDNVCRQ